MSDIEFVFAVMLYAMIVPYVIDPPTPYERMMRRFCEYMTKE